VRCAIEVQRPHSGSNIAATSQSYRLKPPQPECRR
jgi:hypothetical protein